MDQAEIISVNRPRDLYEKPNEPKAQKLNLIFVVISSQLKAFGKAFARTNKPVSNWLVWAGAAIEAYCFGYSVPEEPDSTDSFNSPIPDAWRLRFEVIGYQVESLGNALAMLDANDIGNDDAVAAILIRIASVLKALAV